MKLWRSRSSDKAPREHGKGDLVTRLRKDISPVRNQGDSPEKDTTRFSGYFCDLCKSPFAYSELRQCMLCGRWACPSCWTPEFYVCNSCNGMITLHMLQERKSR